MRLVRVKSSGLTTLRGENAVSPAENHELTTLQAENAVSPDKKFLKNVDLT